MLKVILMFPIVESMLLIMILMIHIQLLVAESDPIVSYLTPCY